MLFNLLALATLAVMGSVAPAPTNALSVESHNFVRNGNAARHHAVIAKRQSNTGRRRCRARPTTLETSAGSAGSGSAPAPTSSGQQAPSNSSPAPPAQTSNAPAQTNKPPAQTNNQPPAQQTTNKPPASSSQEPPKPSPTNTQQQPPPPTNNNPGAKKACVTYSGNVNVPKFVGGSDKIACVINWSPWEPTWMGQLRGAEFIPMLWGYKQIGDFQAQVKAGKFKYALGMNEPNQSEQSQMSPQQGAELWRQYIQPLKSSGYTLVSPAPTNAPSGEKWLQDFLNACGGCTVDHIASHWYGTDAEALIGHLEHYHNLFNRPLWLTEYACQDFSGRNQQCSPDKTWQFMQRTQGFMDSTSWVFRYAYFGALQHAQLGGVNPVNRLIHDDSSPSDLGRAYLKLI